MQGKPPVITGWNGCFHLDSSFTSRFSWGCDGRDYCARNVSFKIEIHNFRAALKTYFPLFTEVIHEIKYQIIFDVQIWKSSTGPIIRAIACIVGREK